MVGREMADGTMDVRDKTGEPVVMSVEHLKVEMPGERVQDVSLKYIKGKLESAVWQDLENWVFPMEFMVCILHQEQLFSTVKN